MNIRGEYEQLTRSRDNVHSIKLHSGSLQVRRMDERRFLVRRSFSTRKHTSGVALKGGMHTFGKKDAMRRYKKMKTCGGACRTCANRISVKVEIYATLTTR